MEYAYVWVAKVIPKRQGKRRFKRCVERFMPIIGAPIRGASPPTHTVGGYVPCNNKTLGSFGKVARTRELSLPSRFYVVAHLA